jgi:hypothetical protein
MLEAVVIAKSFFDAANRLLVRLKAFGFLYMNVN